MKSFTALGLVMGLVKPPDLSAFEVESEDWIERRVREEYKLGQAGFSSFSMGARVATGGTCDCEECAHYRQVHKSKEVILTGTNTPIPVGNTIQIASHRGFFRVAGTQTGRLNTSKPNYMNIPSSASIPIKQIIHSPELYAARAITRKKSVRPGRKVKGKFRILDHSPKWEEQGCSCRYTVIRWFGSTPFEWERVGWSIVPAYYDTRIEAVQAKKELNRVAEVMDS